MHDKRGRCRSLRASRPRTRPHRRRSRRRGQQIIRAALSNDQQSKEPANKVIRVLQASLRTVILRAETAERELQAARIQDCNMQAASDELQGPSAALGAAQTTPKQTGVRKQPEPTKAPDRAASALEHRTASALRSPFRKGSSHRAPIDETAANMGAMPHVYKFVRELVDET